jgi:hypothetical protein
LNASSCSSSHQAFVYQSTDAQRTLQAKQPTIKLEVLHIPSNHQLEIERTTNDHCKKPILNEI